MGRAEQPFSPDDGLTAALAGRQARRARKREVLAGGQDVVVFRAPDWATRPSTWTRIAGETAIVYIEADELTAAAVYHERYGENPYSPGQYGENATDALCRADTFRRASAHDRGASIVSATGDWSDALLDEDFPRFDGGHVRSVQDLVDDSSFEVIRRGEWKPPSVSGEQLKSDGDAQWREVQERSGGEPFS